MNNKHYNKNLKKFARENRKEPTKAESVLWQNILRRKQLFGFKFLRQRPVSNYIVDFMCKEIDLIIEVDGLTHSFEDVNKNDIKRQREIEHLGFHFIRFEDDEILNDFDNVIRVLEKHLIDKNHI
jgi:very-short-patch-repair endonuclease